MVRLLKSILSSIAHAREASPEIARLLIVVVFLIIMGVMVIWLVDGYLDTPAPTNITAYSQENSNAGKDKLKSNDSADRGATNVIAENNIDSKQYVEVEKPGR